MSKLKDALKSAELKFKYLSEGDVQTLATLKKALQEDEVRITCMGLYNHGKSSLLNVLIEDHEGKTFKTADVRETTHNKEVKYGNITFVDTPGLNAQKHDDKRVMDAVKESDINIFVHTVTTGEFAEMELKFFKNIITNWANPKEFINRTIFVASRIDKVNSEEDISGTIDKMASQVISIFGEPPVVIPVSAMRYSNGIRNGKKIMTKNSNIPVLKVNIKELSESLKEDIQKTRKERIVKKYDALIKQLNTKVQAHKLELSQKQREQKRYLKALNNDVEKISATLSNLYQRVGG